MDPREGRADRLELVVLGAGPAYTDRLGAAGAAYLVRAGTAAILLDLGQGSFPRLSATLEPGTLDAVFISHLHPDHFIDLIPLRHYLRYQRDPRGRVRVIGPTDLRTRLDAVHDDDGFCAEALDVEPLSPGGTVRVGPFEVDVAEVAHSGDSHAFRVAIDGAPGLVYSGDCASIDDLVPLIRPGDCLLVEVSFGVGAVPPGAMHLNASMVSDLVLRAAPGRVLLTHLLGATDRAATVSRVQDGFAGLVELVDPGFRTIVGVRES